MKLFSIKETSSFLKIGKSTLYRLIASDQTFPPSVNTTSDRKKYDKQALINWINLKAQTEYPDLTLVDIKGIQEMLNVSYSTYHKWLHLGDFPKPVIIAGKILYIEEMIKNFIKKLNGELANA